MNYRQASYLIDASNAGLNDTEGRRMVLDCGGLNVATVQAEAEGTTAWSTAVLTIYRSNRKDDGTVFSLETATTMTAEGMTAGLDVSTFRYLIVATTTVQSSLFLRVTLYAQE